MEFLRQVFSNEVLVAAALGWFAAQAGKMLVELAKGDFSWARLAASGGMPSSHSATVTALTVATALTYGVDSFPFAMAVIFSFIVIYDARGVRYEVGRLAKAFNQMQERQVSQGEEPLYVKPLKELVGHTLPQIGVGMLIGFAVALAVCLLWQA